MTNSNKNYLKVKIRFIEKQLISFGHCLPESCEYLMQDLDHQKRQLAEVEVLETFQKIESAHE